MCFIGLKRLAGLAVCCGMAMILTLVGASAQSRPATFTPSSIAADLQNRKAEMDRLTLDIKRFQIRQTYCLPQGKTQDAASLDVLAQQAAQARAAYLEFRRLAINFARNNPGLFTRVAEGGERYLDLSSPDGSYWQPANNASDILIEVLNKKRAELASAKLDPCSGPTRVLSADPRVQPAAADPLAGVSRPAPVEERYSLPMPTHFCSEADRLRYVNETINPLYLRSGEIAEQAADYRTRVEEALNALVQSGRNKRGNPSFEAVLRERTWAIDQVRRADRYARAMVMLRDVALKLPVIDCGKSQPTQVGSVQPPAAPVAQAMAASRAAAYPAIAALVASANRAAIACDKAAYDAAIAELGRLINQTTARIRTLDRSIAELEGRSGQRADGDLSAARQRVGVTEYFNMIHGGDAGEPDEPYPQGYIGNEAEYENLRRLLFEVEVRSEERTHLAALQESWSEIQTLRTDCGGVTRADPAKDAPAATDELGRERYVDLRGLGPDRALVLMSGLRIGVSVGAQRVERPSTSYFRIDAGGGFKNFPVLRFNADPDVDLLYQTEIGYRFAMPDIAKGALIGIAFRGWYFEGTGKANAGAISPGPGESLGLFSPPTQQMPFGGYSTGQTLSQISYHTKFESYGGEVQLRYMRGYGEVTVEPWLGFTVGRTNADDRLHLSIGMPAFTSFEQKTNIGSTYVGPTIGVGTTWQMESGLYLQGTLRGGLQFQNGSGHWRTLVPAVDAEPRSQSLSQNKTTYAVGAGVGIGYRWSGLDMRLSFDIGYGNGSPVLKYGSPDDTASGTGGARIGYGSQTAYGIALGLQYRF